MLGFVARFLSFILLIALLTFLFSGIFQGSVTYLFSNGYFLILAVGVSAMAAFVISSDHP